MDIAIISLQSGQVIDIIEKVERVDELGGRVEFKGPNDLNEPQTIASYPVLPQFPIYWRVSRPTDKIMDPEEAQKRIEHLISQMPKGSAPVPGGRR